VLEHLSIREQIALFDDDTPEFEQVKALCALTQADLCSQNPAQLTHSQSVLLI